MAAKTKLLSKKSDLAKGKLSVEQRLTPLVGPILVLLLVAVSSFLLGKNYQIRQTPSESPSSDVTTSQPPTNNEAIDQIESAINNPIPPAPASPTPPPSATDKTTVGAASASGLVNINIADQATLETLKGIGPSKAQAIIDYRNQNGPFVRVEDLTNVKGIGPKTLEDIRAQVTI